MPNLKSFEQFVSEKDRAEEIEQEVVDKGTPDTKGHEEVDDEAEEVQADNQDQEVKELKESVKLFEATVVMDAMDPKSKGLAKLLKKHKVKMEILDMDGPGGMPEVKLTGKKKDLEAVLSDDEYGWDDVDLAEYIKEATGKPAEELKDGTVDVTPVKKFDDEIVDETPDDDSAELKGKLKGKGDAKGKEISESEETEESKTVAEMLTEVYESSCKNEAKAYEEDAHDEHTIEAYMKENAALVGALAAKALKEMKEDYTVEAYEAACNEIIEAYSKKVNELKEMDYSEDAADM